MYYNSIVPGGDDEILEDRDLNHIVNTEDQDKVVNNDMTNNAEQETPSKETQATPTNEEAKNVKPLS